MAAVGGQLIVGVGQRGEHGAGLAGSVGGGGAHLGSGRLGHEPRVLYARPLTSASAAPFRPPDPPTWFIMNPSKT